jgi:hypothetical protein
MAQSYGVNYLAGPHVDRAYALIAALAPDVEVEEWRRFCAATLKSDERADGNHVIVAIDPVGYLKGICVFAARSDISQKRYLDVPLFAPLSAVDAGGVATALLGFLRQAAGAMGCGAIRFRTLEPDDWSAYLAGDITTGNPAGPTILL